MMSRRNALCHGVKRFAMNSPAIIGILVGGQSARMGRHKALMEVEGERLIDRTMGIARSVADDVVLLGQPPFDLALAKPRVPFIPDAVGDAGPMGGLVSLLRLDGPEHRILMACDMPHLTEGLLRRLLESAAGWEVVVPETNGGAGRRVHPCCAVYDRSVLRHAEAALDARTLGMRRLLESLRVFRVPIGADEARQLDNWNAPEDVTPAMGTGGALMRLGILSDSHGDAQMTRQAVGLLERLGATQFIHCGDIGGTAVLGELAGRDCIMVWGNCDYPDATMGRFLDRLDLSVSPAPVRITMHDKRIAVCHGHEPGVDALLQDATLDYVFHGHTHVMQDTRRGTCRVLNPGALYRARIHTVALLDLPTDALTFYEVESGDVVRPAVIS